MSQHAPHAHVAQLERRIVLVRGQRVMLDRDIARIYGVETRVLNQAVRRNKERFPSDFMFQLTRDEIEGISQIVTSSGEADIKYSESVHAFTEHGVAMLSSVLRSSRAIEANIAIIPVVVRLRSLAASTADLSARLDELERRHDRKFRVVFEAICGLMDPAPPPSGEPRREIGFHTRIHGRPPCSKARPSKKVSP